MKKLLACYSGLILGTAAALQAADPLPLDFETAGQFTNNFRTLNANGATLTQTSNGASNDFMQSANGSGAALVYDANGATAGISNFAVSQAVPLTVSADIAFTVSNNSFGIYIINAANEAQGYLAIFNVNNSGGNDQIRFSNNAVPTTSGAGTLGNGSFANNADTGITTGTPIGSAFGSISLIYSINGSNAPVLSLTAGSQTSSITLSGTAFTDVEVGFRLSSGAGLVAMDNLNIITSIPEPSTYAAMAGMVVLGLSVMRRRKTL